MEGKGREMEGPTYKGREAKGGEGREGKGRGRFPRLLRFPPRSRGARIVTVPQFMALFEDRSVVEYPIILLTKAVGSVDSTVQHFVHSCACDATFSVHATESYPVVFVFLPLSTRLLLL